MIFLEFVHTSDLESFNSLVLKYCSKTHSYRLDHFVKNKEIETVFVFQLAWYAGEKHAGSDGFQQQCEQEDKDIKGGKATLQDEGIYVIINIYMRWIYG